MLSTITASSDSTMLFIGTTDGLIHAHDARTLNKVICSVPLGNADSVIALVPQVCHALQLVEKHGHLTGLVIRKGGRPRE